MRTREVPHVVAVVALGAALSACKGCGSTETERPIRYVAKDAEAVLELRDLGALAKSRDKLASTVAPMVPADQFAALEKELTLTLGFDPLTAQGLEEAGLPKEGPFAVQIAGGGQAALWIVPVRDPARFEKTLDKIARARANVTASEKAKVNGRDVTVLSTMFGPEKITVAAYAFERGLALIGAGRTGKELVEKALSINPSAPDANVLANPEYVALDRALGTQYELRLIVPAPTASVPGAIQMLSQLGGTRVAQILAALPEVKGLKSAGWTLNLERRGLEANGRLRLDDKALATMKTIFEGATPPPAGIRAVALDDAVVFATAAANLKAAIPELAPPGSDARRALDDAFAKIKRDIDTDAEQELLPLLSGHLAVALGLKSLAGLDVRRLMEDPRVLWLLIGLGANDPDKLLTVEKRMDEGFTQRGFSISSRTLSGHEVHVVSGNGGAELIVETTSAGGARLFSTEAPQTARALENAAATRPDPLEGKPGFLLELRFSVLSKAFAALDLGSLPGLYRLIATRVLEVLHFLDRATLRVSPAEDGIAIKARIDLSEAAPAAAPGK